MIARSAGPAIRRLVAAALPGALLFTASPLLAAEQQDVPQAHGTHAAELQEPVSPDDLAPEETCTQPAPGGEHAGHASSPKPAAEPAMDMSSMRGETSTPMDMGSMQGGRAPADARDPNAYADGYENSTLPGFEKSDQLPVSTVLADQLEFVSGNEGDGFAWSAQIANGGDNDKLWLRTQGLKVSGQRFDPETGAEALWWHAYSPFWGRTVGIRQDIGRGARTWLALGVEGLAPRRFNVGLTGYVSDAGHLAARVDASYDMLLTNRLIVTPAVETNLYSKAQKKRQLGSGISNVELGVRLRYEIRRKFAPYLGFAWERSFGGTADFQRAEGGPLTERRFVAGVRLWW